MDISNFTTTTTSQDSSSFESLSFFDKYKRQIQIVGLEH